MSTPSSPIGLVTPFSEAPPSGNKILLCSRGGDGALRARSLTQVGENVQADLSRGIQGVWEKAKELVASKGTIKTVNLTKLVVSYTDANGKVRYMDLKGNDSDINQGIKTVRGLISKIWKESFCVENVKGFGRQGLGTGCLSAVGAIDHSADLGGFIASGQLQALMGGISELDRNAALDRIVQVDAVISGLQNGVTRQIREKKEAIKKMGEGIREKIAPEEKKLYVAKNNLDFSSGAKALEEIQAVAKGLLEEKAGLEKELEGLEGLKEVLSNLDRDACYWAVGMGEQALSGDTVLEKALELTRVLENSLGFLQDGVSEKDRKEYAEQVGDLLLSSREDYLVRVMGEGGKATRFGKSGSLEFFVVQLALRGFSATKEEISEWVPEQMRGPVERCRKDVLFSWLKQEKRRERGATAGLNWEARLEIMQKTQRIIPRGELGYRIGRGIGRGAGRAAGAIGSGLRGVGAWLHEALPTRLPFYARGAHLRTSTANEAKEKYFQNGVLEEKKVSELALEVWKAPKYKELLSAFCDAEEESEIEEMKLRQFEKTHADNEFFLGRSYEKIGASQAKIDAARKEWEISSEVLSLQKIVSQNKKASFEVAQKNLEEVEALIEELEGLANI